MTPTINEIAKWWTKKTDGMLDKSYEGGWRKGVEQFASYLASHYKLTPIDDICEPWCTRGDVHTECQPAKEEVKGIQCVCGAEGTNLTHSPWCTPPRISAPPAPKEEVKCQHSEGLCSGKCITAKMMGYKPQENPQPRKRIEPLECVRSDQRELADKINELVNVWNANIKE